MGGDFALAPWRLGVWAAAHETMNTSCFSVFLYLQRFTARCLQGGIEDARSSVDLGDGHSLGGDFEPWRLGANV